MAEDFFDKTEIDVPGLAKKAAKKVGEGLGAVKAAVIDPVRQTFETTTGAAAAQRRNVSSPELLGPTKAELGFPTGPEAAREQVRQATAGLRDLEVRTQDTDAAFIDDANRKLQQKFGERQADVFGAFDVQGNRIVSKANQRNQAAFGNIGGAQTSDASGTGAQSSNLPPNPVAQLASLRETFGTQAGPTGGVAFAPNSAARERNARLNDPRRQFINDLNRQVRRGEISARAAGGIAANLLGQQADLQLGDQKLGSAERIAANKRALERLQLGSQEKIASDKLASGELQAGLDRTSAETIAQSKQATEAAKLGLGVEKLSETQRANLQTEAQRAQQLEQSRNLKLAEMLQKGQLRGTELGQDRQKLAFDLVKGLSEGADPDATMNLLQQVAPELFGNIE